MSKKRLFTYIATLIVVTLAGLAVVYIRFVPRTLIVPDKYKDHPLCNGQSKGR